MVAKQFVQKDWIINDWYLNQDFGYRNLFNLLFGIFTFLFDVPFLAICFRLLILFGFSLAIYRLKKFLRLPWLIFFLCLFYTIKKPCLDGRGVDTRRRGSETLRLYLCPLRLSKCFYKKSIAS